MARDFERGPARAAIGSFSYPGHGTLADHEPTPIAEIAAAGSPTIDRAGDRQGQAPEGTSGDAAARIHGPANACSPAQPIKQSRAKAGGDAEALTPKAEPVSRAAAGRSAAATSELCGVTAGETAPEPHEDGDLIDEEATAFIARVNAASARRAELLRKPEPIDWNRVAAAHARKASEPRPVAAARPLPIAASPEECRRCGIPGRKGCAHQLPYVAEPIASSPYSMGKRNSYGHQGARA